jgi:hypothetical protein
MHYRKPAWLTWRLIFLGGVLLALIISGALSLFIQPPNVADGAVANFLEPLLPLYPFLLTPVIVVSLLCIRELLATFLWKEEDSLQPLPSRGELRLLLTLKRRGSLLRRSWLVRKLASKTGRHRGSTSAQIQSRPPQPDRPEKALDRLLRLKRTGSWNP